jgi:hypothetical protein
VTSESLNRRGTRAGPPAPVPTPADPRESAGENVPPSVSLCAGDGQAEQEESLVADARCGLTPSQMVDRKLAGLLGTGGLAPAAGAAGQQEARRTSGAREGAGPALATC